MADAVPIYFEKQYGSLCGQHALNNLLQQGRSKWVFGVLGPSVMIKGLGRAIGEWWRVCDGIKVGG